MTTTVEAIYDHGTLKLPRPLPLPELARVIVTIDTEPADDRERAAWLKLSA
jgi:predicted DNA-binding antitoxin AbrB/MazE fold protein